MAEYELDFDTMNQEDINITDEEYDRLIPKSREDERGFGERFLGFFRSKAEDALRGIE